MNFRHVIANLTVDIKQFTRNKAVMFWTLAFPILIMLLFGAIFSGLGEQEYHIAVQNNDGGVWSTNLTDILNDTGVFIVDSIDPSEDPEELVRSGGYNTILVIPDGYSDDLNASMTALFMSQMAGPNATGAGAAAAQPIPTANLTAYYDPTDTSAMTKVSILSSVLQGMNQGLSGASEMIVLESHTALGERLEFIDFFTPGIIAMSVMTSSLFGTVGINTELKQKGVLRKLATTPLSRPEWLLSNILYQLVMATLSVIAILLVGMAAFGLEFQLNIFLPVFVILNVFTFAGIGMLITRFVKEAQSAEAAANAIMFPMMFLSGIFFSFEMMPAFMQSVAKAMPLYYVAEGLRDSLVYADMAGAAFNALVIGVIGMTVFVAGVFLTSWKDD